MNPLKANSTTNEKKTTNNLCQVHRLQQKLDEFKRMNNEEFYKVKRDEVRIRKQLDEVKLRYQRSQDALDKLRQKEDEVNEMQEYFQELKDEEDQKRIQQQLQFEKEKHSLLGLIKNKDKEPILCLLGYLELPEVNKLSLLSKSYHSALWHSGTYIWKAAYRNNNKIHQAMTKELQRQIDVKKQEIRDIVPAREFNPDDFADDVADTDITMLLKTYWVDNTRVGESIQATMFNAKTFLNKQFAEMRRLFELEQQKLLQQREAQRNAPKQKGGLFGMLFNKIGGQPKKEQDSIEQKPQEANPTSSEKYLLSTMDQPPPKVEEAKLIDFDDDPQEQQNPEKEVPMKIEDEESKLADSETHQETVDEQDSFGFGDQRVRSDSLASTSTNRMYSRKDLSDIVSVDELHKFMYKWGAMLVTQSPRQMEEWVDWMQRTLAEYYVRCQALYTQAKEVEMVKDFLSLKLQAVQHKLNIVTNEKEDLLEHQNAESGIKEYLAKQMQDLNTKHIEKTHELVMAKQKLAEAHQEVESVKYEYDERLVENEKGRIKLSKELKALRKHSKLLEIENKEYKDIFSEMEDYIARLLSKKAS